MASNVRGKPITVKQTSKGVLLAAMDDKTAISICLMKNATDGALKFVKSHDYDGQFSTINPYPSEIPSGQWATFVHSSLAGSSESIGAVVYSGTNPDGTQTQDCEWMMSWWNIYGDTSRKVYTEFGNSDTDTDWGRILEQLNKGSDHSEACCENWCATLDVVPDDDAVIFKGIIKPK